METTLDQYLEGREAKGFVPAPQYFKEGDFVTYYRTDERCYAKRIDELLTVYQSEYTHEIIGCKIKDVSMLIRNLREHFSITVEDESVKLGLLFLSAIASEHAQCREEYYWLGGQVGEAVVNLKKAA